MNIIKPYIESLYSIGDLKGQLIADWAVKGSSDHIMSFRGAERSVERTWLSAIGKENRSWHRKPCNGYRQHRLRSKYVYIPNDDAAKCTSLLFPLSEDRQLHGFLDGSECQSREEIIIPEPPMVSASENRMCKKFGNDVKIIRCTKRSSFL